MNRPLRDVPARVPDLVPALTAALDGTGPAVRVLDDPSPGPAVDVPDQVALVVRTSGSSGRARDVMLPAAALRASAEATAARLAGPGAWLLALPTHHVAGLQVVLRALLAGGEPTTLPEGPFRAAGFVEAAHATTAGPGPHYTSLVPTQLVRVLDAPAATDAAREFDAVLVGGAACPAPLLARAHAAGLHVVTTYGMTETCGGCVYDGRPLDGVTVAVDAEQRVSLSGPVLAAGYLHRPDLDATTFTTSAGRRWLRTADRGRLDDGVLHVLGRLDDVLVTGGVKVDPLAVEELLGAAPGVREVCVVGVPDQHWGQSVVAVVVTQDGTAPPLTQLRATVAAALGPASAPRQVLVVDELPVRGPGKPDRRAVARLAAQLMPGPPAR
ncbi:AMP-dependent synthetase and ligase [Cellulomonas flavigena DSM 20109]|uniref:AMP-dependent synthetase and ligase n=1 Tax=Cellulomonas flavigena (strain ATCC 482 / DSM 20109 / BCRC 11376 / JCM 18109 / NBRC 3775 / NCIMB 8073 / NRS 134) TaxID=446466 RepID=D5UJH5_CELFN|nr:o-succinylbenzoate--CoA ligase [Cellulomonas flavigena]ADG75613.1 AMP-dependent synthetase and ligase [Cellulomonas flavigena DSM 20109]